MIVALLFSEGLAQVPAFPGAEGYGAIATGGRGGRVIAVTNLNDNGPGSLRAAIGATGPRTVVFRVSGTIKLLSKLTVRNADITIAGQTAPGDGICVRDYSFYVSANNVIIRYMRFRLGDSTRVEDDAFSGYGSLPSIRRRIILDHCSASWAIDENSSCYDNAQMTMQWCYNYESLYNSYHSKGPHGYGGIQGGWHVTFHHNLYAHNSSRNPRFNGARYTNRPDSEVVDFRNNALYNWGFNSIYGGERGHHNIVANYFKPGPATDNGAVSYRILQPYADTGGFGKFYINGNVTVGNDQATADNWTYGVQGVNQATKDTIRVDTPFDYVPITEQTPEAAFNSILLFGGASLHRDTLDARIAREAAAGTATYGGTWGVARGIIDSQDSVGGWPLLNSLPAPADTDHDGMPDDWETANGLNPADSTDGPVVTGDGYTNLEHYINGLVPSTSPDAVAPEHRPAVAREFSLAPNFPNPFNPSTTILYTLPDRRMVTVEVFNILGTRVAVLARGVQQPGEHRLQFRGDGLGSGVYFTRVTAGSATAVRSMLLMK